jgi:hypothetical protein
MTTETLPNPRPTQAHADAGVFLTPRVLDQRAFDELSRELRDLVRDAGGQEEALRKTTGEVRGLSGVLRTALRELQERLERAGKVSPALEQWVKEAQELTTRGIDPKRVARELERAIEGIVESRRAEFEHAVAPTVEALRHLKRETDRVKQSADLLLDEQTLRARVDAAVSETLAKAVTAAVDRAVAQAIELANARVTTLEERTNAACRALAEQSARAEAAAARAEHALNALNNRAAELERETARRFAAAEDRLAAAERRVTEAADAADRRTADLASRTTSVLGQVEEARRSTQAITEGLEFALASVRGKADQIRASAVDPLVREVTDLSARAATLAGLPGVIADGERMITEAQKAGREADAIRQQIELARRLLGEELLLAAGKIDELSEKAAAIPSGTAGAVRKGLAA